MAKSTNADDLFPQIYGELRRVARRYLAREGRARTLQPTALVNEAYLHLQSMRGTRLEGRTHGLALCARAMRRVLIDHGRMQKRVKRDGGAQIEFDTLLKTQATEGMSLEDMLLLEEALTRLEAKDPRAAKVVELRFFAGLSVAEVAEHLGVSTRTVEADWTHARAWLKRNLS